MTESRPIDVLGTIWHTDRHERTSLGCLVEAAKDRVHALHARVTGRHSFEDAVRAADEPIEPSRTTLAERPRAPPSAPTPSEPPQI